jgi:hypothetical protein
MDDSILVAAVHDAAGVTTDVLGHGTVRGPLTMRHDGIRLESSAALDLLVARVTFAPGSAGGSLLRTGLTLGVMTRGSVTRYAAEDSSALTYASGLAFIENGPTDGSLVRNEGSVDAEMIVVLLAPCRPLPRRPS